MSPRGRLRGRLSGRLSSAGGHLALALRALVGAAPPAAGPPASPSSSPPAVPPAVPPDAGERLAALTEERDYFGAVLEVMEAAVVAIDGERRITVVNRAARELLALRGSPVGRTLGEVVQVDELDNLLVGEGGKARHAEFELPGPPRRVVVARVSPRGASGGLVVVIHDITELRRLETMRRDFVANVSHELRTPVSVIRANAETLLDGALDDVEMAESFVEAVLRNAERLSRLVSDLLDLSRIEVGQYKVQIGPLPVAASVRRVVEALESRIEEQGLSVTVDVSSSLVARADAQALEQILTNLVDNAVKYTPQGGVIALRGYAMDGWVRLEVQDNGPGIDPVHHPRLFERFYRVDPGRSRQMGGTGLGLAIVKHLAAALRGRVGMSPAEHRGCIFWLELPAAKPEVLQEAV